MRGRVIHLILVPLILITQSSSTSQVSEKEIQNFYAKLIRESDRKIVPPITNPLISVSLKILPVTTINYHDSTLHLVYILDQKWRDRRLTHNLPGDMTGGHELYNLIWKPDTVLLEDLDSDHPVKTCNSCISVTISASGLVTTRFKHHQLFPCDYDYFLFPVNQFWCDLRLQSRE